MALITLASIKPLLRPGLRAVFADWMIYPAQWRELYTTKISNKAVEYETEMQTLSIAKLKEDSGPIQYGDMQTAFTTSYYNRNFGTGYQITDNALSDNLYESQWPQGTRAMKDSLIQCKNVEGAAMFNNGFNPNFPVSDGQALFSIAHPVNGATSANTFAQPAALQETSLEDALIGIQKFLNAAGLRVALEAEKLAVPPELQYTAERLMASRFRTNTGNNDVSATYNLQSVRKGYVVNQFFLNPNAWFLLTSEPNGNVYYERDPLRIRMFTDTSTFILNVAAIERYSFGTSNWRAEFGSQGV